MEIRFLEENDFLEFKIALSEFYQYAGNRNPKEYDLQRLFRKARDENSNYYIAGAFDGKKRPE